MKALELKTLDDVKAYVDPHNATDKELSEEFLAALLEKAGDMLQHIFDIADKDNITPPRVATCAAVMDELRAEYPISDRVCQYLVARLTLYIVEWENEQRQKAIALNLQKGLLQALSSAVAGADSPELTGLCNCPKCVARRAKAEKEQPVAKPEGTTSSLN